MKKSNRRTAEFVFDGRNVAPPSFKPTPQSWREASLRSSVVLFPFVILKVSFFFFAFVFLEVQTLKVFIHYRSPVKKSQLKVFVFHFCFQVGG